jgi:hypothetical protein
MGRQWLRLLPGCPSLAKGCIVYRAYAKKAGTICYSYEPETRIVCEPLKQLGTVSHEVLLLDTNTVKDVLLLLYRYIVRVRMRTEWPVG